MSLSALGFTFRDGLDAGGDVAAMGSLSRLCGGRSLSREAERTMVARFSADGGASFGEELRISDSQLGACACCSMAAEFLSPDSLMVAYRSAVDGRSTHAGAYCCWHVRSLVELAISVGRCAAGMGGNLLPLEHKRYR